MKNRVKITVLQKLSTGDVYGDQSPCKAADGFASMCDRHNVGDVFIVEEGGTCPADFCSWAFADIQRDIVHLRYGGNYPWVKDDGVAISCCTDGLRPVFFKIERIA